MVKLYRHKLLAAGVMGLAVFAVIGTGSKVGATEYKADNWSDTKSYTWNTEEQEHRTHVSLQYYSDGEHATVTHSVNKNGGHKEHDKHKNTQQHTDDSKDNNRSNRSSLSWRLQGQTAVTVKALIADHHNSDDAEYWSKLADRNSVVIATMLDKKYLGIKTALLEQWREHAAYYHKYLEAKEHGDEDAKSHWKDELETSRWDIATLIEEYDETLDKDAVQEHLKAYDDQMVAIIDNIAWGNDHEVRKLAKQAILYSRDIALSIS
jgi:hypothetical protein